MKCIVCNKETGNNNKYCSEECHRTYWNVKRKKVFKEKICEICGSEYTPKIIGQKYCSPHCGYVAELKSRSKKTGTKKCKHCGKTFEPYTSLDKFCSANCRIENQKSRRSKSWVNTGKIIGDKNPAYRNGNYVRGRKKISVGERIFIKNNKEIKRSMINDVGYLYCEYCGTNNSLRFESHHIIYRSEKPLHGHLHDKENILITCIRCHNELHKHKEMRNAIVKERALNEIFGNDVLNK